MISDTVYCIEADYKKGRASYKYKVKADGVSLKLDYVFGETEADALIKARIFLDIPDGANVSVERISDVTGMIWRLN